MSGYKSNIPISTHKNKKPKEIKGNDEQNRSNRIKRSNSKRVSSCNVSPLDHYGIAIEIHKGTIEFEDDLKPELYLVSRDDEDRVTASICIDEDSIESIEEYGGTYTLNFAFCMTSIEISEYKTVEEIRKQYDKC